MKQKIKNIFTTLRNYLCLLFLWLSTRKIDKKLTKIAAEDRSALLNENDVEFLRSIGGETTLEKLREATIKVAK